MLKSDIKSCPSVTNPFFQARCAPGYKDIIKEYISYEDANV